MFSDLGSADDVNLLLEIVEILMMSLGIVDREAHQFGMEIMLGKTKIRATVKPPTSDNTHHLQEVWGNCQKGSPTLG